MYQIAIQIFSDKTQVPSKVVLRKWAQQILATQLSAAELTIRIVDVEEMSALNKKYRAKIGPTNVLSFPIALPADIAPNIPMLGDIIICTQVVNDEARVQHKQQIEHWAHMVVHGIFHLLGYDHATDAEASMMESLEIAAMKQLGFPNPYHAIGSN